MKEPGCKLRNVVQGGLLAVVVMAPTQWSFEVAPKIYVSPVDPLLWLVCAVWLIELVRARQLRSLFRIPLVSVLFLLAAAASTLKAVDRVGAAKELFQFVEYLVAAYLLFSVELEREGRLARVTWTALGAATAIVLVGLAQYLDPATAAFGVRGTFGNRNVFGGYLCLMLPLAYGLLLYDRNRVRQIWLGLLIVAGLSLTLAGGALVGMLVALTLLSVVRGRVVFIGFAVLLVAALLSASVILPRENGPILGESVRLHGQDNVVARRYTEWQAAAAMMRDNAVLGVGAGNYQNNIGSYYGILPSPVGVAESDSQNLYLVIGGSMGWPGLIGLVGLFSLFAARAARHFLLGRSPIERGIALGVLGGLVAFSISAVWSPLLVRGLGIPLVLLFAMADCRTLVRSSKVRQSA